VVLLLPLLVGAQIARLDTASFVVVGEGLAAGFADFALRDVYQKNSFPALMARQMGSAFPQPLIQPPGIGGAPGFPQLPVAVPAPFQTTVRTQFPPTIIVTNLAVPGHWLTDALNLRPSPPLSQPGNPKQTATNVLLGLPSLLLGKGNPLWTQVEYAGLMNPTIALVELGYAEALEAAVTGDPGRIPDPAAFRADYARMLAVLRANSAQVIATTIPDPFDTAYFSTAPAAAALTGVSAATLVARYDLQEGDLLTPQALFAIGGGATELPSGSVIHAATAAQVRLRVSALNSEIANAAREAHALLYDLHGLFARIRQSGLTVGSTHLTADYLGGFYSLSGSFPGMTGHALIANEILALLNQTFRTSFSLVDLSQVAPTDPAVRFRPVLFPR
jgi:hypothetical protein